MYPEIQPLPRARRRYTFLFLVLLFVLSLPALFLYATGYRISFNEETPLTGTGGIYVSADRTGAEIYIDGELVRETRTFRQAFYAQGLEPGTHRVRVQKTGHHTWVKELPVYSHIVTEALAFNMPEIPRVRVISPWRTGDGISVIGKPFSLSATTTNELFVSDRILVSFVADTEYATLRNLFASSSEATPEEVPAARRVANEVASFFGTAATSTATTTKHSDGAQLMLEDGAVNISWVGSRDSMPYYYCAKDLNADEAAELASSTGTFIGPVLYIPDDATCDPSIRLDNKGEEVRAFDFYPGSTDLVLLALSSGIYVVEADNRSWQNVQPLLLGEGLDFRVENGAIYVYDGVLIYQVVIES